MSQWQVYQYMAVDPSAFCAFGIRRRKEATAVFFDLWAIPRAGGPKAVLATYEELESTKRAFDRLVKATTEEA